jgi:hypothetical protein
MISKRGGMDELKSQVKNGKQDARCVVNGPFSNKGEGGQDEGGEEGKERNGSTMVVGISIHNFQNAKIL